MKKTRILTSGIAIAIVSAASPLLAQDAASADTDIPAETESSEAGPNGTDDAPPALPVVSIPPPAPPPIRRVPAPRAPVETPPMVAQTPVTQLSDREEKLQWMQSPVLFLPGTVESGKGSFLEQDTVLEVPLVWAMSARLGSDVTIAGPGDPVVLKAGEVLPRQALRDDRRVDEQYTLFCTRNRIIQKEQNGGFLGNLERDLWDSMRDAQWCLQDTDSDGELDLAVVLNAGSPVAKAADIAPVPYESLGLEPIAGGEDFLRISLNRVGKRDVGLWLTIMQRGKGLKFDSLTSGLYRASRFTNIGYSADEGGWGSLLGVRFTINDADRKGNRADIEWVPTADLGPFVVIPTELFTTAY